MMRRKVYRNSAVVLPMLPPLENPKAKPRKKVVRKKNPKPSWHFNHLKAEVRALKNRFDRVRYGSMAAHFESIYYDDLALPEQKTAALSLFREAQEIWQKHGGREKPRENPREHIPKTTRGRPASVRNWTLEQFHNETRLSMKHFQATAAEARTKARDALKRTLRGKKVNRVILDGPL